MVTYSCVLLSRRIICNSSGIFHMAVADWIIRLFSVSKSAAATTAALKKTLAAISKESGSQTPSTSQQQSTPSVSVLKVPITIFNYKLVLFISGNLFLHIWSYAFSKICFIIHIGSITCASCHHFEGTSCSFCYDVVVTHSVKICFLLNLELCIQ